MNYEGYYFSLKERVVYISGYITVCIIVSYLFYDNVLMVLPMLAGVGYFLKQVKKEKILARKKQLSREFVDTLASVSTALGAGYSIENAFLEAKQDILTLYGEKSYMASELFILKEQLALNMTMEEYFHDFSKRASCEDITDFCTVFAAAKKGGGQFHRIIQRCIEVLKVRNETEKEIDAVLSGKKMEQKIMSFIPFVFVFYMRLTSKSYLAVFYHNPAGIVFMTVCLAIYLWAYRLSQKIVAISV